MDPNNENKINTGPRFGVRHIIVLHTFILMTIAIGMRITLSVTIVAMTDNTTSSNPDIPTYNWTNKSVILSSFYWGYIMLQILAGVLGKKYGTKEILMVTMLVNTVAFSLIPLMADKLGSYGVMICRVVQGLSQGFFFTSCYTLLGRWAPVEERSLMAAVVLAGAPFGSVITTPIVGYICSTSIGWPPSFYIYGGLGILWVVSWFFFGASNPAAHKSISKQEKDYIERSVGALTKGKEQKQVTPWRAMLTSLPVYAIVITNFGQSYGYATLMTEMPNYMSKVMKFDIQSNGLLSSLPYLVAFVLGPMFGSFSDFLINHKYLSTRVSKKLFTTLSAIFPAVALLVLSYLPDDAKTLSVLMLIIAVGGNSAMSGGFLSNHMDLSPRFSGIIMALGNTCATICAIVAPLVVQFVVTDETDKTLWRTVFIISSTLFVSTLIFYLIFAAGELQSWNGEEDSESIKMEEADMKIRKISTIL